MCCKLRAIESLTSLIIEDKNQIVHSKGNPKEEKQWVGADSLGQDQTGERDQPLKSIS
jgi:hypothetical protein